MIDITVLRQRTEGELRAATDLLQRAQTAAATAQAQVQQALGKLVLLQELEVSINPNGKAPDEELAPRREPGTP